MISATVRHLLDKSATPYWLVPHWRTYTSMETAAAAHIPGDRLAKSVLVREADDNALVVIPSTHQVRFSALRRHLGHECALASEEDAQRIFRDCEIGSIPPVGQAYAVRVLVDETLLEQDEVYFEGGDHEELVRVSGDDFRKLMERAERGRFSRHI